MFVDSQTKACTGQLQSFFPKTRWNSDDTHFLVTRGIRKLQTISSKITFILMLGTGLKWQLMPPTATSQQEHVLLKSKAVSVRNLFCISSLDTDPAENSIHFARGKAVTKDSYYPYRCWGIDLLHTFSTKTSFYCCGVLNVPNIFCDTFLLEVTQSSWREVKN